MYEALLAMLVVATLMLLDYLLTIVGFSFYQKACVNHVKIDSYELNPFFRNTINAHRYSRRHALSVVLVVLLLFLAYQVSILTHELIFWVLFGVFVGIFGFMNYRHIRNIYVFHSLIKFPDDVQGVIRKGRHHLLERAKADAFGLSLFLGLLSALSPSFILAGATLGTLVVFVQNERWEEDAIHK